MPLSETFITVFVVLAFFRFLGGVLFLDFYSNYKERRFLTLTLAFILFSFAPTVQLFIPTYNDLLANPQLPQQLLLLFSEVISLIAVLLFVKITWGYATDTDLHLKILVPITIIIIFFAFLMGFFQIAYNLTQISKIFLLLTLFPLIFKFQDFFKSVAKNLPLFMVVTISIGVLNSTATFFDSEFMIWIELITKLIISFLLPVIFVNFEYNLIGMQKFNLKDKYSHSMSQILQVIVGETYLVSLGVEDRQDLKDRIKNIDLNINEIVDLISWIREI